MWLANYVNCTSTMLNLEHKNGFLIRNKPWKATCSIQIQKPLSMWLKLAWGNWALFDTICGPSLRFPNRTKKRGPWFLCDFWKCYGIQWKWKQMRKKSSFSLSASLWNTSFVQIILIDLTACHKNLLEKSQAVPWDATTLFVKLTPQHRAI